MATRLRERTVKRHGSCFLLAVSGTALMLGACAAAPDVGYDVLDPRLAGPCKRLNLSWFEDVSRLRVLMRGEFEPRTSDGNGEIEFNLLRCGESRARQPPLTFAFLSVPILADSAPLVVTGMPDDGWVWLPIVIADGETRPVFSAMGYDTEPAEIGFEIEATDDAVLLAGELIFASGSVSITARVTGRDAIYTGGRGLVSADSQYHSVFFGSETGDRFESISIDVDVQGNPPLTGFDWAIRPRRAVFDRNLRLDRVYWRLPRASATR